MSHVHILAEVNTERCDDARRELAELQAQCSYDELRISLVWARRLHAGRQVYGYLDLARDKRDWKRERAEEYIDLAIYDACDQLARAAEQRVEDANRDTKNAEWLARRGIEDR